APVPRERVGDPRLLQEDRPVPVGEQHAGGDGGAHEDGDQDEEPEPREQLGPQNAGRVDRPEPQPVGVGGVDPRQNLDEDDEDDDGDGDGTTATRDRDRPTGTAGGTDGHRGNSWTARAGMLVSTTLRKCPASPAGRWLPPARRLVQRIQRTVERGHLEQPDAVRGTL